MQTAEIFASPSTREGFGITYAEAMAANCTVIGADHPESPASEVIGNAGFVVESITDALRQTHEGDTPTDDPVKHARQHDWDTITDQAATYQWASEHHW